MDVKLYKITPSIKTYPRSIATHDIKLHKITQNNKIYASSIAVQNVDILYHSFKSVTHTSMQSGHYGHKIT